MRGHELPALCQRFNVDPSELGDPDARVPASVMIEIWAELPDMLGIDALGIAMARRVRESGALPVLTHLVRSARTVREGFELAQRYGHIVQDAAVSRWHDDGDIVRVTFESRTPTSRIPRQGIDFMLGSLLLLVREATRRDWKPLAIAFEHARPKDDAEAQALFACPLSYGAPKTVATLSRAEFDAPLASSDPHLVALLERHARELERRLPRESNFASEVERALAEVLATGDTRLAAVAAKLRSSTRTVQRRLRAEHTTHQRVLDELRRKLSLQHLREGTLGIKEIAFVLGFSDQSAFHHAFVRWTGQAPGEFRKARK